MSRLLHAVVACLLGAPAAFAQPVSAGAREPLQLSALQKDAIARDARARESALLDAQSTLRMRNIDVERLPSINVLGQSQYQSDVPTAPLTLPGGQPLFSPAHDTHDLSIRVDQKLVDPTRPARIALARAELAEGQTRVRTSTFALKAEVNDAFFTAALLQEQSGALEATIAGLEARWHEAEARVREGTALAGEAAALEATLLQQRQRSDELRTGRAAALARLSILTGRTIADDAPVAMPELGPAVSKTRDALDRVRARPEYEQFDRVRDRVSRQQDLTAAVDRPQLSAYARAGYGRPGLNFISDQFESYGLAGVQLQWKAWTWGASGRERDALAIQKTIVDAEESSFTDSLRRAIQADLATIDRLERTLATDDRIVGLREAIERASQARLREGVITSSEYVDRDTERLNAEFDRARHRVELAQARARVLTTLGLEVQ